MVLFILKATPKGNERMSPEKGPFKKQNSLPTIILQGVC